MNRSLKISSIKQNYIYNTLYQILTMITPLITVPYVSRILGVDNVGIQSFTKSVVTYFTLFAALGTVAYGQREIAMNRNDKYARSKLFWEIELLSIFTTAITIVAWSAFCLFSKEYSTIYYILTFEILSVAFDVSWLFMGLEQFKFIVIRNSIVKIGGIILIFVFIKHSDDLYIYIAINAISVLMGNVATWTYLPKVIRKVCLKDLRPLSHLKGTISYFIPTIAVSVYTVLDRTMIGAITGSEVQNGNYEQASKIIQIIKNLIVSLNIVMSSRMSYLFSQNRINEIKNKMDQSFGFLFFVAIPSMFGLIGISTNFVPWFFGRGYEGVVSLLCILSPLPWIICVSNTLGNQYLTPSGQRVRSSKGIVFGAIVNVIANAILIPRFAAQGAAIGTIIAELSISITYIYMSKDFVSIKQLWMKTWKRLIAGFIMLFVVWSIGKGYHGSIIITICQMLVGISVYLIMLLILHDTDLVQLIKIKLRKL